MTSTLKAETYHLSVFMHIIYYFAVKRNPVFNRVYNLVCCYPSFQTTPKTPERGERERRKYRGDEEPYWIKTALDINAIILVTFAAFLFGFFH